MIAAREILTADDVAAELKISRRQAYLVMRRIPHLVEGRLIRVTRKAFDAYLRRIEEPACDCTSADAFGGAATTIRRGAASSHRRAARTAAPPSSPLVDSSGKALIPVTRPRTRPRSVTPSNDS
jgi:hypothetical protein